MIDLCRKAIRRLRLWLPILLMVVCVGCKERLYSDLRESEANEMLSILIRAGISAEKKPGAETLWNLDVDKQDIARATEVLKKNGYPKDDYNSIGEIFKKEGLVSSPVEERIRYIYALSQEVGATISQIDGVLTARVHIVLPQNDPLDDTVTPSSASVFIKHLPDSGIESQIFAIKELVVNSIEGLAFKNVSVALFPSKSAVSSASNAAYVKLAGLDMAPESADTLRRWLAVVAVAWILLFAAFSYLMQKTYGKRLGKVQAENMRKLKEKMQSMKPGKG